MALFTLNLLLIALLYSWLYSAPACTSAALRSTMRVIIVASEYMSPFPIAIN